MVIALIIAIPVSIALTGFIVLKAVQLGLRWQIQTQEKKEPTLEIKNPVAEVIQAKATERQMQVKNEIYDEWLNGPKQE